MERDSIEAKIKRAVLVEAGHRCAIPTCRATTTEIAHIVPWAKSKDNSFENLIALCPNCHSRFDQKKEIDEIAIKMYKQNLGILNNRYSEVERLLFTALAQSGDRVFVLGAGGDIMVANAVRDGFFIDQQIDGLAQLVSDPSGNKKKISLTFTYWVTDAGAEFIKRYANGVDIS
ncbi:MAG: HNH endonuclease [Desulfatirhabdiaceae bacterium]